MNKDDFEYWFGKPSKKMNAHDGDMTKTELGIVLFVVFVIAAIAFADLAHDWIVLFLEAIK